MKPTRFLPVIKNPLRFTIILILSTISIATALAQGMGPAGPSPVTGHASVVSTGTLDMPEDSARWHVTRHTAEEGAEPVQSTGQGFIIAENTPVLVIVNGTQGTRLAGGEAMSIPAGTTFTATTFGAPDTYLFVQLLPESGTQLAGATDRVLTSASFSVEPGAYDTDLVRDVLSEGEEGALPAGTTPTVVYVAVGELEITNSRGTLNLIQGDSATFEGEVTITAIADGSTYYAGFVGAPLPAQATPAPATPEATPAPATPEATEVPVEPTAVPDDGTDSDGDGLSDVREAELGTNPAVADTDDDGMSDGNEVNVYFTDPLNSDTDGDWLYDGGELIVGSDPNNRDTDGDGLTDGEEYYVFDTDAAVADTDGDGVSDGDEVRNGTDPLNASSR